MRKKILSIIFILALATGLMATSVSAAVPVQYESSIQLRNLTGTAGTITLTFYNLEGVEVASVTDTIAANETKSFYQSTMPVAEGFDGSVVIASDVAIAAESNLVGLDATKGAISYAAYGGFSEGSIEVYLPTLFKNNFGYNTFYYVQNTGSTGTDVSISYSDGITNSISNLQPGQSQVIRQSLEAHTPKVFSATLTSTVSPIAVTVVEEGNTLFSYNGFGSGSTNPIMPLINQNNYGYFTGVQIQNSGVADSVVTVTYAPSISGTACFETRTIPAGGSKTFSQYVFYQTQSEAGDSNFETNCVMGQTFIGSGKVTANSNGTPLVAVVNQLQIADNKGGAYAAFDPTGGLQKIIYPLIMDRNYGYFTSWSIVNVGTSPIPAEALTCQVTGASNEGEIDIVLANESEIPVDGSWTLNHQNIIADGFVGGATCVGPVGAKMIGTSNQLGVGSSWAGKDSLLVSEGFIVAAP